MVWCMRGACFRHTIVINQPEKKKRKDHDFGGKILLIDSEIPIDASAKKTEETRQKNGFLKTTQSPPKKKNTSSDLFRPSEKETDSLQPTQQAASDRERSSENTEKNGFLKITQLPSAPKKTSARSGVSPLSTSEIIEGSDSLQPSQQEASPLSDNSENNGFLKITQLPSSSKKNTTHSGLSSLSTSETIEGSDSLQLTQQAASDIERLSDDSEKNGSLEIIHLPSASKKHATRFGVSETIEKPHSSQLTQQTASDIERLNDNSEKKTSQLSSKKNTTRAEVSLPLTSESIGGSDSSQMTQQAASDSERSTENSDKKDDFLKTSQLSSKNNTLYEVSLPSTPESIGVSDSLQMTQQAASDTERSTENSDKKDDFLKTTQLPSKKITSSEVLPPPTSETIEISNSLQRTQQSDNERFSKNRGKKNGFLDTTELSKQRNTTDVQRLSTPETTEGSDSLQQTQQAASSSERLSEISEKDPLLLGRRRSGVTPVRFVEKENDDLPVNTKNLDDERLIRNAIENNDFLSKLISEKRMVDVIAAMYIREIAPKETIIKQGDKGSHMYVSATGKYQTIINGKMVSEFADIRVFGELAILYNAKRLATIRAVSSGRVWVLDSNVYQQIVIRHNIREQDETMHFLMNNEILKVVGKDALQVVANLLKSEFFPTGKEIVRQGDKGQKFYIIRAGTVTITKKQEGVVGVYKKGDCFGELALLEEDCRQATVTANAPGVECLTLSRKEFIDHLGDIKNFKYIRVKPKDSIKPVEAEYEELDLMDLKIRKTLGVGGFGRVELVQHTKNENLVFALKYLKKVDVVAQSQEEHVYNEKNIQMACRSPFIVRLYRTYKDKKYIYFLMESCLGGDLWSMLQTQKNRRFEEKEARFICACVLEAFDYLHSRGVVYRDLKPENLLIAMNGYIKLTDFGFAKKLSGQSKTFTFAGTPEYVAPEIVLNRGHNRAVDYWAYGAFIFEMLTGKTPFRTDDSSHMRTYNKILSGIDNIRFPTYVNLKARHLIEKLCQPVASERLGMSKGGIQDIKKHKWYLGFDWQAFAKLQMPSPFKPKLSSPIDTKYFDQFKRDNDSPPEEVSGWDEKF